VTIYNVFTQVMCTGSNPEEDCLWYFEILKRAVVMRYPRYAFSKRGLAACRMST